MGRPIHDAVRIVLEMNGLLEKVSEEDYTKHYIDLLEQCLPESDG